MPELPEVETIKLGLQKYLVGRRIEDVDVRFPKVFIGDAQLVVDAVVQAVRRFGKGLVIDLDNGYSMAVHVKMTGQLVFRRVSPLRQGYAGQARVSKVSSVSRASLEDFPKHTHVVFKLRVENGELRNEEETYLYYNDVRQFGWIKVLKTEDVATMPFFKSLGLEPLKDLTLDAFKSMLKKNKTPIKSFLMDQSKIAGIGNIYACDSLYFAKIHPTRSASSLKDKESALLFLAIEEILKKSIAVGGASASNYVNALGEKGTYQEHFLVYKKEGEPCKNCSSIIKRIKTAGRSTFFCSICQK